ncbi:NHL repeat-containing protein [Saccharomonospora halophila]|uniref:hypothetical protein n=1 Tax=Saccharomonospora halophila TaxID=129922 RepID=UPI0006860E46|nr:hypothetical protein [Saccharomonospora halophila]
MPIPRPEGLHARFTPGWAFLSVPPRPGCTIEVQEHVDGGWAPTAVRGAEHLVQMYAASAIRTEWRARYVTPDAAGPWTTGHVRSPDTFDVDRADPPPPTPPPSPHPAPQPTPSPAPPTTMRTISTAALVQGRPWGLALDTQGNLVIADADGCQVRRVTADGASFAAVAGTGQRGDSGDGGPAVEAELRHPTTVALDRQGNVYLTDPESHRVRKVSATDHTITTVAGTGREGDSGDGGPATDAELRFPNCVAVDGHGNLFLTDPKSHRVRKVSATDHTITTVAGTGREGDSGDGGPATRAEIRYPNSLAVDGDGNLYFGDTGTNRVRRVSAADHTISTVAGTGDRGGDGDGGPAIRATLSFPVGLAVDGSGNLYIADSDTCRVRKVSATDHTIVTIAGNGHAGDGDERGPATGIPLDPGGVATDGRGNLFVADFSQYRIRRVAPL